MTFKPGQSGNPAGRPKKLLKRIDEVLHGRGIEPIEKVLELVESAPPPTQLRIWMELLPYVYARPKDVPDDSAGSDLRSLTTPELEKRIRELLPDLKKESRKERAKAAAQ